MYILTEASNLYKYYVLLFIVYYYYEDIDSESRLLVAKSRIAPRDTSIPRLELAGAHMLSSLLNHVKDMLPDYMTRKIYGWVDSTTVLHWLQGQGRWTQFIRNRTKAIREKDFITRHYVPTEDNPADMGSRGATREIWMNFGKVTILAYKRGRVIEIYS